MTRTQTAAVIGGGIVGLAVARELTIRYPGLRVTVFDKEDHVAAHQSGHNSGVVHAGLYYAPGSLKARLCVRGGSLLREFCAQHDIRLRELGKPVESHVIEAPYGHDCFLLEEARQTPIIRRFLASA